MSSVDRMERRETTPALLIVLLFVLLSACKSGREQKEKYSIYILAKDGNEYLLTENTLDSGVVEPRKTGVLLDPKDMDRDVFVKDGYFYHLNRKTGIFSQFFIEGARLNTRGSVILKDFSIDNFNWISKDSLMLTGMNRQGYNQAKYALLNAREMKIIAAGNLPLAKPSGQFSSQSVGFVQKRKNQIYIGYTYHKTIGASNYTSSDTFYVADLAFPAMKVEKVSADTRSTYPGGPNTIQSYGFTDQASDYYFMSCPGIALGNRQELPTGIFRINNGENHPDSSYFINISKTVGNHAYGMWYLGGDEAIIRAERKDLYKDLNDHYSTAHFEFYIINLKSGAAKKLDLPLDKGTRRECVIVEGNTAYISVNSNKEGNFIWLYDIKSGKLKKGLQLAGDTDFIMRIDRLNN